jgi:hypothetical protein
MLLSRSMLAIMSLRLNHTPKAKRFLKHVYGLSGSIAGLSRPRQIRRAAALRPAPSV